MTDKELIIYCKMDRKMCIDCPYKRKECAEFIKKMGYPPWAYKDNIDLSREVGESE